MSGNLDILTHPATRKPVDCFQPSAYIFHASGFTPDNDRRRISDTALHWYGRLRRPFCRRNAKWKIKRTMTSDPAQTANLFTSSRHFVIFLFMKLFSLEIIPI